MAAEPAILGTPTLTRVGRVGPGQNAGPRLQGQTKRLTFRKGRLRLHSKNALPDLKVRRLGGRGEADGFGLDFLVLFGQAKRTRERSTRSSLGDRGSSPAMTTKGRVGMTCLLTLNYQLPTLN